MEATGLPGFYRLWSLREAMAKAVGVGLFDVNVQQDLFPSEPLEGVWRHHFGPQTWIFGYRVIPDDYSLALALLLNTAVDRDEAWNCFRSRWHKLEVPTREVSGGDCA